MNLWRAAARFSLRPTRRSSWMAGWMVLAGFFLVMLSAMGMVTKASAQPPESAWLFPQQQGGAAGKAIFEQKCTGCHSIGGGKLVGPDLQGVSVRRSADWIKRFILDPAKMLASDPVAQQLLKENNNISMPNLNLTPAQADQLVEFLTNPGTVPAGPAVPAVAGDPQLGMKQFTGEQSLANGGPACIACHTVEGTGALGGGGLGPDLTHVFQRLGEPGLNAALKTIAFPTMIGPFQNHALSANEIADLVAFFKRSDQQQPAVPVTTPGALSANALLIFGIGAVAAGLLFGLLLYFWVRIRKVTALRLPVRKV